MSTLEEFDNDETSQNISELPMDTEVEEISTADRLVDEKEVRTAQPMMKRKSSRRYEQFDRHNIIPEDVEAEENETLSFNSKARTEEVLNKLERADSKIEGLINGKIERLL